MDSPEVTYVKETAQEFSEEATGVVENLGMTFWILLFVLFFVFWWILSRLFGGDKDQQKRPKKHYGMYS